MSLSEKPVFEVADFPIGPIAGGTSVLLTGEDRDALETVFYRLVASNEGERSLVLATDSSGNTVTRALDGAVVGASDRSTVLTCRTEDPRSNVRTVDDLSDLTGLGMEFSSLLTGFQSSASGTRAGIFLCSSLCAEVDDTRTVFRFLNSNLLGQIRRNEGLGVCALDTSTDVGANTSSLVTGMETSFTARIDVEVTSPGRATLQISGLDGDDETVEVAL